MFLELGVINTINIFGMFNYYLRRYHEQ